MDLRQFTKVIFEILFQNAVMVKCRFVAVVPALDDPVKSVRKTPSNTHLRVHRLQMHAIMPYALSLYPDNNAR